ncbi:11746_t:CDS:2 [Rhizophagus irregularis]|nr:11746_t:CDS:2 [Rhizophagus irregularis]
MAPTINSEVESEKFQIVLEGCDGKLAEKSLVQPKKRQPLDIPDIHLPFPPMITASEIFEKTLVRKLSKHEGSARKSPNKFLIYRTVVVLELHRQNIHYSMTEISGAIAKKWREEPKNVKDAYTKLASQIDPISMSCNNNYNSNMYSPYIPHTICPPYYLHPQQQSIYHDSSNYHPFKQESYDTVDSNSFLIPI